MISATAALLFLASSAPSSLAFVPNHNHISATCSTYLKSSASTGDAVGEAGAVSAADLLGARDMIDDIVGKKNCGPILVRLAWHDSGTFDKDVDDEWPAAGGANGSIRFDPEIKHGANAGLTIALNLLEPVKEAYPNVSYADIFQLGSARSIELAGGPKIDMKYGRVDATDPSQCSPEGNLPDGEPDESTGKFGGPGGTKSTEDTSPFGHLRKVFYRQGFDDEGIVALSGAHTFGRAFKDRSGLGAEKTKFTDGTSESAKQIRADGSEAKYGPGGSSWTKQWLRFDNSYFTTMPDPSTDPELLKMSTDTTLFSDEGFKPFAEKFRESQDAFL